MIWKVNARGVDVIELVVYIIVLIGVTPVHAAIIVLAGIEGSAEVFVLVAVLRVLSGC